jgi:pyruvate-formate lyase-activating enzyme
MENIQRIRFASKGLAVAPGRITEGEPWTEALIHLSNQGRKLGKQVCLHTHINHPREITWVTKKASNYLFKHGVIVRNQSVLLKGVNDDFETLSELIKTLARINIQPVSICLRFDTRLAYITVLWVKSLSRIVADIHQVLRLPMRHGKRHRRPSDSPQQDN